MMVARLVRIRVGIWGLLALSCGPQPSNARTSPVLASDFDRAAALATLREADARARGCLKEGGLGAPARVAVTFGTDGRAKAARLEKGPQEIDSVPNVGLKIFGTELGSCVEAAFLQAQVPPFSGSPLT